ncbi:hypothetical protein [Burkholderia vietnamiensis]|uniref:hypothetical protein n=1 Tax=Burkholderia vietnamiensis TaxID=60552 RepID=UPI00158C0C1A|nr:hypothetical protein [Burkholderia vietnamiensis]
MKEPILSREQVLKIVEPFADEVMMLNHQGEIMRCIAALESALLEKLCGEPRAWLVEGGRMYRDKAFIDASNVRIKRIAECLRRAAEPG